VAASKKPTKTVAKPKVARPKAPRKAATTAIARAATPKSPATKKGAFDLVIVESPAKAKTINKYLGSNFKVLASYGHVRDLPRRRQKGEDIAGVKIKGWIPTYVVEDREDSKGGRTSFKRKTSKQILAELGREASKAGRVFLATDPDREGEAIAWHIEDELKLDADTTFRIAFQEITRSAVQQAIANPGKIDAHRVKAQEARRILDRVVGYPLSNLLGQKVTRGLSAGRVQSVAVRLIVEREREIEAFKPDEYWKIAAILAPQGSVPFTPQPFTVTLSKASKESTAEEEDETTSETPGAKPPAEGAKKELQPGTFRAELTEWHGEKFSSATEAVSREVVTALDSAAYAITKIEQKDQSQRPQAPFTTSTMQQQASLRLHFAASRTMQTAQQQLTTAQANLAGAQHQTPHAAALALARRAFRLSDEQIEALFQAARVVDCNRKKSSSAFAI
jgi:DNA topoisomerase-1